MTQIELEAGLCAAEAVFAEKATTIENLIRNQKQQIERAHLLHDQTVSTCKTTILGLQNELAEMRKEYLLSRKEIFDKFGGIDPGKDSFPVSMLDRSSDC